jgi:hypothetical protein
MLVECHLPLLSWLCCLRKLNELLGQSLFSAVGILAFVLALVDCCVFCAAVLHVRNKENVES